MSNFSNPFKKQPTAKESAKGVKKEVRGAQRELDRELRDIDRREAQLIAEIKKEARNGRDSTVRVLAKNLVQLRSSRERLLKARGTVGNMATQASAMAASITVADTLQNTTKVMHKMNKSVEKSALSIEQYQREAERMNMTEEAMGDMLSEAFDTDELDDEADAVVGQVLAEVGLDTTKDFQDAPTAALPEPAAAEADTDALLRQLNAL